MTDEPAVTIEEQMAQLKSRITEALVKFQEEYLAAILQAVAGYRQHCIDAEFSSTAAEQMSLDYHRLLISKLYGVQAGL